MHRLDPRAKLITVFFFIIIVVSVPGREVMNLFPYFVYPVVLIVASGLSMGYVLRHILLVSPFIVFLIIFAPLFDTQPVYEWHRIVITSGILTMWAVFMKFVLTVGITLFLISTTRFDRLLKGLLLMHVPKIIVMQFSFLYRYLFLLIDEAHRMKMARDARSYGHSAYRLRFNAIGNMLGILFLKTLDRAEMVYTAMVSRGFSGNIPVLTPLRLRPADYLFIGVSIAGIAGARLVFTG